MIVRNQPGTPPQPAAGGQRRAWLVVAALVLLPVAVAAGQPLGRMVAAGLDRGPGPEQVVEQFFTAIAARDLDTALGLVNGGGAGVPYGQEATFLHPDAIGGGWWPQDIQRLDEDHQYRATVQVIIADDRGQVTGLLDLADYGRGWLLDDPFITVEFAPQPLSILQVNDRRVVLTERYDLLETRHTYRLLPGRYEFFGHLPGGRPAPPRLLLPPGRDAAPLPVRVPRMTFDTATRAAVQQQVDTLLDDCARARVRAPAGCPFAADTVVGPTPTDAVHRIRDIRWTVVRPPVVALHDPGGDQARAGGLPIRFAGPGMVRLTVTGQRDSRLVQVTVDCTVDGELRVLFGPDGSPRVHHPPTAVRPVTCPPHQELP